MPKKVLSNLSIVLCLLIFSVFILALYNLGLFIGRIQENLTISVFLSEGSPDEARINTLITEAGKIAQVKEVTYISRDKAMAELLLKNPELSEQVKALGQSPLPASLEIRLVDPLRLEEVKKVATTMSGFEGIESAEYPEMEITKLAQFRRVLGGLALVFGLIMLAFTTLIMVQFSWLNFKLNDNSQAGNRSVRLKEAALGGLVSGIITLVILYALFSIPAFQAPYLKFLPLTYAGGILVFSTIVPVLANWYFNKSVKRGEQAEKG